MSILRMLLVASMIMGFTIAIILLVLYLYADQQELSTVFQKAERYLLSVLAIMVIISMVLAYTSTRKVGDTLMVLPTFS